MKKGERKWRITIERADIVDDGFARVAGDTIPDVKRWAKKTDISDGEKVRAAAEGMNVTTRFIVPSDSLTRTLTAEDVLICDEIVHSIVGIKEIGWREDIEITTVAQPNGRPS